jgi:hypothetical protein
LKDKFKKFTEDHSNDFKAAQENSEKSKGADSSIQGGGELGRA